MPAIPLPRVVDDERHVRRLVTEEVIAVALSVAIAALSPFLWFAFLSWVFPFPWENLERPAAVVVTDSGGIQEETTALGIPCLTLRENTERPITVELGTNVIVGTDTAKIIAAAKPPHPSARASTAQGSRNTVSTSKTMNRMATT